MEYIRPSDQELFNRFSPDIQQKSLEEGPRRAREFDEYVGKLKEWSKSDKSSMFRPGFLLVLGCDFGEAGR